MVRRIHINACVEQALNWRRLAEQDGEPLVRYQHAVQAMAFLNVARSLASDEVIEQISHVDVRALARGLEQSIQATERELDKSSKQRRESRRAAWIR